MTTKRMGEEQFRWFHAIVVDNMDPEKLGRVKIRVTNDHDDPSIQNDDLPWATPIGSITSASHKQVGRSPTGLLPGSHVFGFFLDGHEKQLPILWGSFSKIPGGSQDNNDVPALAREINSLHKTIVGPEPSTPYAAKYPYNHVTQTQSGHIIEVDDTPSNERLHVYHKSGSYIEVDKSGQVVVKSVDNSFDITVKNKTVYIGGNIKVQIMGPADIQISGSANMKASNWNITGDIALHGTLRADGDVIAGGISLENHIHSEAEESQPTGKPI